MSEIKKPDYRLLFLIASQKIGQKAEKLLTECNIPVQYHIHAKGTASSEFADIIGLGGVDKSVIVSVLPKNTADKMLSKMRNQLYLGTPNSGVAFTVSLSSASARIMQLMKVFDDNSNEERIKTENMDNKYCMIMAFVNQGFSEDVMAAAKPAGAGGGTVFHSRRVGSEESVQLWGISVQQEREIVLILAHKDNKKAIMQAISEKCGTHSEANGTVIAVPVDNVEGLNKDID